MNIINKILSWFDGWFLGENKCPNYGLLNYTLSIGYKNILCPDCE
jgi:hypothetical protein